MPRAARLSFTHSIRPQGKLAEAARELREDYERTSTPPPQISDTKHLSLTELYTTALENGLRIALQNAGIGNPEQVSQLFAGLEIKTIQPRDIVRYYNSHPPMGANRLNENVRLPYKEGTPLSLQDKKLYHGAQNLAYYHARRIVEGLAPYLQEDDRINIDALRPDAQLLYKHCVSRGIAG
jgi:hypothetical protein